MPQSLKLYDGTIIEPAHAILSGDVLWIYIDSGITLVEAFDLISDPEKTQVIDADEFGDVKSYTGFTDLFCIRRETNGQVNAGLRRTL